MFDNDPVFGTCKRIALDATAAGRSWAALLLAPIAIASFFACDQSGNEVFTEHYTGTLAASQAAQKGPQPESS